MLTDAAASPRRFAPWPALDRPRRCPSSGKRQAGNNNQPWPRSRTFATATSTPAGSNLCEQRDMSATASVRLHAAPGSLQRSTSALRQPLIAARYAPIRGFRGCDKALAGIAACAGHSHAVLAPQATRLKRLVAPRSARVCGRGGTAGARCVVARASYPAAAAALDGSSWNEDRNG